MSNPVNCRYFFGDYFRGKNKEECRLIGLNPQNGREWRRKLCETCPVPLLLINTDCSELALEAEVKRKLLRERVEVTFAVCTKHMLELQNPNHCPRCAEEQSLTYPTGA
jgi:hypothetical protein